MAREFKVGDKIMAFECHGAPNVGQVEVTITGIIQKIEGSFIMTDRGWFHSKQCRKLVKKERRVIYVSNSAIGNEYLKVAAGPMWTDSVKFIEVKKK